MYVNTNIRRLSLSEIEEIGKRTLTNVAQKMREMGYPATIQPDPNDDPGAFMVHAHLTTITMDWTGTRMRNGQPRLHVRLPFPPFEMFTSPEEWLALMQSEADYLSRQSAERVPDLAIRKRAQRAQKLARRARRAKH